MSNANMHTCEKSALGVRIAPDPCGACEHTKAADAFFAKFAAPTSGEATGGEPTTCRQCGTALVPGPIDSTYAGARMCPNDSCIRYAEAVYPLRHTANEMQDCVPWCPACQQMRAATPSPASSGAAPARELPPLLQTICDGLERNGVEIAPFPVPPSDAPDGEGEPEDDENLPGEVRRAAEAMQAAAAQRNREAVRDERRAFNLALDRLVTQRGLLLTRLATAERRLSEVEAERDAKEQQRKVAIDELIAISRVGAETRRQLEAVWSVMPKGSEFLDPPDGGDVPLHEQVRRVVDALATARRQLEAVREGVEKLPAVTTWVDGSGSRDAVSRSAVLSLLDSAARSGGERDGA